MSTGESIAKVLVDGLGMVRDEETMRLEVILAALIDELVANTTHRLGRSILEDVLKAVSPDFIFSTEDRYDSGRLNERIRIRNAVVFNVAAKYGIRI